MGDEEIKLKLLEAYPPQLADRILAFRAKGDGLSARRRVLAGASDDMDGKMWQRAFEQLERESEDYRREGETLKKEMESWISRDEKR